MSKSLKLHGHIKLKLYNSLSGNLEKVVEGDNIITKAVPDIMKYNLLGMADFSKITGNEGLFKEWFGGVVCYNQQHSNLNANDYWMPNGSDNPVIAHAGMTPIDTDHDDDMTRGQAVGSSFIRTANSMKLVWEWGPTHGNGIIRALSLTHSDTGSFGNGVDSYHFRNTFAPWKEIQNSNLVNLLQDPRKPGNAFCQYDENHTLFFYLGEDGWYKAGGSRYIPEYPNSVHDVTVYIRRLPYTKAGLFDVTTGATESTDERKFTVTTSLDMWYNPAYFFDPDNKYLWLFTNFTKVDYSEREWSKDEVYYSVIDCESETEIDSGTIYSDDEDLAFLACSADGRLSERLDYSTRVIHENVFIDDGYVYLPMGNSQTESGEGHSTFQNFAGWKKINLSDNSDQEAIPMCDDETVLAKYWSIVKAGDLHLGFGWVENGGLVYPCNPSPLSFPIDSANIGQDSAEWDNMYINENESPVVYVTRRHRNEITEASAKPRYILANKLVNTSKFNLSTAVQKSSTNNMTVEYTLTEATS